MRKTLTFRLVQEWWAGHLHSHKTNKGKLICHYSPRSFQCQGIVNKIGRSLLNVPRFGDPGDIDPLLIELLMLWTLVTIKIQYSYFAFEIWIGSVLRVKFFYLLPKRFWKNMGFNIIFSYQGSLSFQMVKKTVCLKLFSAVLDSSLSKKDDQDF